MKTHEVVKLNKRDFSEMLTAFLAYQDVKPSSLETYRKSITRFLQWTLENRIDMPTREDIIAYKHSLEADGLRPDTISGYIMAVKKFFKWTAITGQYPNIADGLKGAGRKHGHKRQNLTPSQVKNVLAHIDRTSIEGRRNYALLNLLVRTGLRTIEIIRANIEDIKQEGGAAVLYIQGKGRNEKDDFVLLTDDTLQPIREYIAEREDATEKAPLFSSLSFRNRAGRLTTRTIRGIVKSAFLRAGIKDERITAHSLRHTAITLSLLGGASIQEAQRLGRHANINTTMIYAHNIDRITNAPERRIDTLLAT